MSKRAPGECLVLVVDDDPDVTTFLSSVLSDAGFRVGIANGGLAALDRLREAVPDLISLDLVMPGHSGIRVLHDLRKNPEWSRIPVMVVSGHSRDEEVRRGLEDVLADSSISGPSLYLEKPVTAQKYLDAVSRILKVELEPGVPQEERARQLRKELAAALEGADASTLEAALQAVRAPAGAGRR